MYIFRDFYPLPNCLLPLSLWISPIVVIYSSSMLAPWSGIVFLSPVTLLEDRMRGAYPHTTSQRQDSSLNYRDFLTYSLSLSPSLPPSLPPSPRLVRTTRGHCSLASLLLLSTKSLDLCPLQHRPLTVSSIQVQ